MPSTIQTILAVALPLGLCLLFSIAILLGFVYRQQRQHHQHQQDTERLQKRLKSLPQGWDANDVRSEVSEEQIRGAFLDFGIAISDYVDKWITYDLSSPQFNDSMSRIEALLFPEPTEKHGLNVNKDTRMFRNPHNYTTAEIKVYLEQVNTRWLIAKHLMMSIILPNVTLDGDPFKTILPFYPQEVCALDRLFTLIRGVECKFFYLFNSL
jgi:hypothetical protein